MSAFDLVCNLLTTATEKVNKEKFVDLCAMPVSSRGLKRAVERLSEKARAIVQAEMEGMTTPTADDVNHLIARLKTAKDNGDITGKEFHDAKSELKKLIPGIAYQVCFTDGTRETGAPTTPTGLAMIDFDNLELPPHEMYLTIRERLERFQLWKPVLMMGMTPSREGLRMVVEIPYGMQTPGEAQRFFTAALGMEHDTSCESPTQLSCVVPWDYWFYHDLDRLFADHTDPENRPHVSSLKQILALPGWKPIVPAAATRQQSLQALPAMRTHAAAELSPVDPSETYTDCDDITLLDTIVEKWMALKMQKPAPVKGERNPTYFSLLCDLAKFFGSLVDDDELAQAVRHCELPDCPLEEKELRAAIKSARKYAANPYSAVMKRVIAQVRQEMGTVWFAPISPVYAMTPPPMPHTLPRLLKLLTKGCDETNAAAVALAVLPPLAAHLKNVVLIKRLGSNIYNHLPYMMNVLVGQTGVGKGCINGVIAEIMADIKEVDELNRAKLKAWSQATTSAGKTGKQPVKPRVPIITMPADITSSRLNEAASFVPGRALYFFEPELEAFERMANDRKALHKIFKDSTEFEVLCGGQERATAEAVHENATPRFCINASTTSDQCLKFFAGQETTGSMTRFIFSVIILEDGILPSPDLRGIIKRISPWIGNCNKYHDLVLTPSLKDVNNDRLASMTIEVCPQLGKLSQKLFKELNEMSQRTADRVFYLLMKRCLENTYRAICVLYIANGMKWEKSFEDFARWMVDYTMWVQYRLFGDKIRMAQKADRLLSATPVVNSAEGIFESLPDVFTKDDVRRAYIMAGLTPKAAMVVMRQWKRRGKIEDLGNGTFRKVEAKKKAKALMA